MLLATPQGRTGVLARPPTVLLTAPQPFCGHRGGLDPGEPRRPWDGGSLPLCEHGHVHTLFHPQRQPQSTPAGNSDGPALRDNDAM